RWRIVIVREVDAIRAPHSSQRTRRVLRTSNRNATLALSPGRRTATPGERPDWGLARRGEGDVEHEGNARRRVERVVARFVRDPRVAEKVGVVPAAPGPRAMREPPLPLLATSA